MKSILTKAPLFPVCKENGFYLLDTDITEAELLIRMLAGDLAKRQPEQFNCDRKQVFYKLKYVNPEDGFEELRKLILLIHEAKGLRSRFKGIIAIDVNEYKSHEDEAYFTILLKYLFDNAYDCKVILVCSRYSETELVNLQLACMKHFLVQNMRIHVFETDTLGKYIQFFFEQQGLKIEEKGTHLLEDALKDNALKELRNLQLIERLPREFLAERNPDQKDSPQVGEDEVNRYLKDPFSSLTVFTRGLASNGEENLNEHNL